MAERGALKGGVPVKISGRRDRLGWRVRYAVGVGVSRWEQYCVHGCDVGAVMSFAAAKSCRRASAASRGAGRRRVLVPPGAWCRSNVVVNERCESRKDTDRNTNISSLSTKEATRGKHESLQRWWALEGDVDNSLSKVPQARPLQLRVQRITAGQTIHFTTISHAAAGKSQIGNQDHKCST